MDFNINNFFVSRVLVSAIDCQHGNWFDQAINTAFCNKGKLIDTKQFTKSSLFSFLLISWCLCSFLIIFLVQLAFQFIFPCFFFSFSSTSCSCVSIPHFRSSYKPTRSEFWTSICDCKMHLRCSNFWSC